MKRLSLFHILVIAILCSTAMATAQNSEAPQRYGWGYPDAMENPVYSLYFRPLYGDVEAVTIKGTTDEGPFFWSPYPYFSYFTTYIFNTRGDVVACVGKDDKGEVVFRSRWEYNDYGKVVKLRAKSNVLGEREVSYMYDSSARLVGASVTISSDFLGEFSYNVTVNNDNRKIIDLFGIDFFVGEFPSEILYCCPGGKISPVPRITDKDLIDMPRILMYVFDCDDDGVLDIQNIYYNFTEDISLGPYCKIFLATSGDEVFLYSFNSNNQITLIYGGGPGDGPTIKWIYNYDINGRLVGVEENLFDDLYEYSECEYDDEGKLIRRVFYEGSYVEELEPVRELNYVYDSHGNLIRLLITDMQYPENSSSVEYLIKYRE